MKIKLILLILTLSIYSFTSSNHPDNLINKTTIVQSYPINGTSPYNSYFGSGVYNSDDANWKNNS